MKFDKHISRILAYSLIFSVCNCVVDARENMLLETPKNLDVSQDLVPYKKNEELVIIEKDKTEKKGKQEECYICRTDPVSYFMPSEKESNQSISEDDLKNAKKMRCPKCGELFHDICAAVWISAVQHTYNAKGWYCPSCSMKKIERTQKDDRLRDLQIEELENKNIIKSEDVKKETKTSNFSLDKKDALLAGFGILILTTALKSNGKTEVHVHYDKN